MNLKIKINRLYQPEGKTKKYASIRDYQVKKALKAQKGIEVSCKGKTMTIPLRKLKDYTCNGKVFKSSFGKHATYKLWDYAWVEDSSKQEVLI